MVVFIAEDRALPLVNIAITVRTGSWLEPAGKEGLAAFTGSQMRRGGTKRLSAEAARRATRLSRRADRHRDRRDGGLGDTQLPRRQPRRVARALPRGAALAAFPGGPPRPGQGAVAAGDAEAQRRVGRHRRPRVLLPPLGTGLLHQPLHHRGLGSLDQPRGHACLPREILPSGEHDRGGVRRVRQGRDAAQARAGLCGLALAKDRGTADPVADLAGRTRSLPRAEGREPGAGFDRSAHHPPRRSRRLRARGDERDPRRQRLHLADHQDGALERGPRLLRRFGPVAGGLLRRPLPRRVPVEEPQRALRDRARPATRSAACASSRSRPKSCRRSRTR